MEYKPQFSEIEQLFNNATKEVCWSCSKPRNELEFLEEKTVGVVLQTKGKNNYIHKWGKMHNKFAPDFVILTEEELQYVWRCLNNVATIGVWKNPFRDFTPSTRKAIEIFGDYWHSENVIGVNKEEHVRQVKNAYNSIGWDVEIIWESELRAGVYSDYIRELMTCGKQQANVLPNQCSIYMNDVEKFKVLDENNKRLVVDDIFNNLRKMNEPLIPSHFEAICDLNDLEKRIKSGIFSRGIKSNVGQTACKRFCKSILGAKPRTENSLMELWNDDNKLKNAIYRQLNYFTGSQTIGKIKNELLNGQGYRCPSNFPPLTASMIYKEMGLKSGDTVFDPCAGYGGRMLAAWASGINYVGIDANSQLISELKEFAVFLNGYKEKNKIELYHGAIEDKATLDLIANKKIKYVFTSPPYFDLEHYSEDSTQSDIRYNSWQEYRDGFLLGMFDVIGKVMDNKGKFVLNIPEKAHSINFYSEIREIAISEGWSIDNKLNLDMKSRRGNNAEVLVSFCKSYVCTAVPGFGVKNAPKNYYMPCFTEGEHYVICKICGERFARLSQHLRRTHTMSITDYLSLYPDSLIQAKIDSDRVALENTLKCNKNYMRRVAYKCPSGRIVLRKNLWQEAWDCESPPEDTILDARKLNLDKWSEKEEGIDYVVCNVCGYKSSNLMRHVKREHNVDDYGGELKCQKVKDNLHKGALLKWDRQGRKPKRDFSTNKTHKRINGKPISEVLTKDVLQDQYITQGLSAMMIAAQYGLTEGTILLYLKKHEINANYSRVKKYDGKVLLSVLAKELNVKDRVLKDILTKNNIAHTKRGMLNYFDYEASKEVILKIKPNDTMISVKELAMKNNASARQIRDTLHKNGVTHCQKYGKETYYTKNSVERLIFR